VSRIFVFVNENHTAERQTDRQTLSSSVCRLGLSVTSGEVVAAIWCTLWCMVMDCRSLQLL